MIEIQVHKSNFFWGNINEHIRNSTLRNNYFWIILKPIPNLLF